MRALFGFCDSKQIYHVRKEMIRKFWHDFCFLKAEKFIFNRIRMMQNKKKNKIKNELLIQFNLYDQTTRKIYSLLLLFYCVV